MALLLTSGYVLLATSWFGTNPPGGAPDETAHYIRAAGLSQGQWVGGPVLDWEGLTVASSGLSKIWLQETSRDVYLPAHLNPPAWHECYVFRTWKSATCVAGERTPGAGLRLTYVGAYQPYAYVLPALLMKLAANPSQALGMARLGVMGLTVPLLSLALLVACQGRREAWGLIGIMTAATPMVLFLTAAMTSSGVEIAAALSFFSGLIRVAHAAARPSALQWCAVSAGGFVLAIARPTSWAWLLVGVAAFLLMAPTVSRVSVMRDRRLIAVVATLMAGLVLGTSWSLMMNQHFVTSPRDILANLGGALASVPDMVVQEVGVFGWTDTPPWAGVTAAWLATVAAMGIGALALGSWGQRMVLLGLIATNYVAMVGLSAIFLAFFGPAVGRYTLPLAVSVPLYAGEILYQKRFALFSFIYRAGPLMIILTVAACQLLAWWWTARRYAVGTTGRWLFPAQPGGWQPNWGWLPWIAMATAGAACIALTALSTRRQRPATRDPRGEQLSEVTWSLSERARCSRPVESESAGHPQSTETRYQLRSPAWLARLVHRRRARPAERHPTTWRLPQLRSGVRERRVE
jgi:Predicted membrane protein (DUF2142)